MIMAYGQVKLMVLDTPTSNVPFITKTPDLHECKPGAFINSAVTYCRTTGVAVLAVTGAAAVLAEV